MTDPVSGFNLESGWDEISVKSYNDIARYVFDQDGYHAPMLIATIGDATPQIIHLEKILSDPTTKQAFFSWFKSMVPILGITRAVLIVEAWSISTEGKPPDSPEAKAMKEVMAGNGHVKDKLGVRQEVLTVQCERHGFSRTYINPIIRKGDAVELGETRIVDGQSDGLMSNMFEQVAHAHN